MFRARWLSLFVLASLEIASATSSPSCDEKSRAEIRKIGEGLSLRALRMMRPDLADDIERRQGLDRTDSILKLLAEAQLLFEYFPRMPQLLLSLVEEPLAENLRQRRPTVMQHNLAYTGVAKFPIQADGSLDWATQEAIESSVRLRRKLDNLVSRRVMFQVSEAERAGVERFYQAYELSVSRLYEGHNALIHQTQVRERLGVRDFKGSLHDFVSRKLHEMKSLWWADSLSNPTLAQIDGTTSRSFARSLYGEDVQRRFFWAANARSNKPPHLDEVRIVSNFFQAPNRAMIEKSLEVFARDSRGDWQPFIFHNVAGEHLPMTHVQGMPVRQFCATCHMQNGKFSPRPIQLKSESDFREVGYRDADLIQEMMRY